MTDENLDTLRAAIQAFNCRDFDVALVRVADEATWAPFLARTETSLLRGKSQIRLAWERHFEVMDLSIRLVEIIASGDDRVWPAPI
jgi:hypothetical protein